jgi:hypothetical protein
MESAKDLWLCIHLQLKADAADRACQKFQTPASSGVLDHLVLISSCDDGVPPSALGDKSAS